jgi:hypothetical protein
MNPFILLKNWLYFITLRQKNKRQEGFERENITWKVEWWAIPVSNQ